MSVNQIVQPFALAAAVAANGTVVVGYPSLPVTALSDTAKNAPNANLGPGNFLLSDGNHTLKIGSNIYKAPKDFTLTFGAVGTGITITNKTAGTWPAGLTASLGLDLNGALGNAIANPVSSTRVVDVNELMFDLGSPVAGAATAIAASQAIASATNAIINGTIASAGAAQLDVPRGVNIVSSSASDTTTVITVTGKDEYGNTVVEAITANGTTTVAGKKAFAIVTKVAVSAAMVGNLSVGSSNVLGLPLALRKAGQVTKELQDGAVATAGTFVYALQNAVSTSTSADVRGTYVPNSTPNGTLGFLIAALLPDPSDIGFAQFAG